MLQKCYDCNNSVTNGENGSKYAIVGSGDQNIQAKNWKEDTNMAITTTTVLNTYIRADELEAGSCKLGKQAGCRDKLVTEYAAKHGCKYEAIIDAGKGWKAERSTFEAAVLVLRMEVENNPHIKFLGITHWNYTSKNAKVCCHVQWLNITEGTIFSKTINLLGVRWKDI